MFGMMEAMLNFLRRQIGLRTDSASASGSLHAKVKDIADNKIGDNLDKFKDKVSHISRNNSVANNVWYIVCDIDGSGYLNSVYNYLTPQPGARIYIEIEITIDGTVVFFDFVEQAYVNSDNYYAESWGGSLAGLNFRFNTSLLVRKRVTFAAGNAPTANVSAAYLLD